MSVATPYPILEERALGPAQRRLLLGSKRNTAELPMQRPGTVLVFEVGGRHQAYREGRHLRGVEDDVVGALSVSIIDVRERPIWVELAIPSDSAADDFLVGVCFRCRVTDPEKVAAAGLFDIVEPLRQQLYQDSGLVTAGVDYPIGLINAFRSYITARLTSLCQLNPPRIEGLSVQLSAVRVATPDQLRDYERQVRDGRWRRRVTGEDVEWLEELSAKGSEALNVLAISRGELSAADAAVRAHAAEAERQRIGIEALRMLHEDKLLDRIPIDATRLVDSIIERVTGVSPAVERRQGSTAVRSIGSAADDDSDGAPFIPGDHDAAN